MLQQHYRPTFIQVNLQAIQNNINRLKGILPEQTGVIAVVKANGYGHGDIAVAQAALEAGANLLAVATPEEALHLREVGIQAEILLLGTSPLSFLEEASKQNITLTAYSYEWLNATRDFQSPLKLHIKIDSGMGRIGFTDERELKQALAFIRDKDGLQITGVFTHFATADEEEQTLFQQQITRFERLLNVFEKRPPLVHTSNSAAALMHPSQHWDAVRFGISMYGIAPSPWVNEKLPFPLEKALSLHTEVTHIKKVPKGSTIGYGATYVATADEWVATIPIGYADGLLRKLHNQSVLIEGKKVPIVGKICMDQCMIRLDKKVKIGEQVVLIGKQGMDEIQIEEWAEALQTIPYEVCCNFSNRIPRIYSK